MADVLTFHRGPASRGDRVEQLLFEYGRLFRYFEDCLRELTDAIEVTRHHRDCVLRGRFLPDVPPELLASILLHLVSDLFALQSAINGLRAHLNSLTAGAEPR